MRVAVLSDIHSNLAALDAVLGSLGTVDAVWHLGDVVGYGPEPDAVVARLREAGAIGVKGNHDDAACGGETIEWFNTDGRTAAEWTRGHMDAATLLYLAGLPELLAPPGTDFTLVHGSPRDHLSEYLDSRSAARDNMALLGTRHGLFGHTHVPWAFRQRGRDVEAMAVGAGSRLVLDGRHTLLNPGSVGQPRDGDPDAAFMILDTEAGHVTWHRVAYDIASTQAAIVAAGLPVPLARRLSFGL
jgi:predicted phosphodiesterase